MGLSQASGMVLRRPRKPVVHLQGVRSIDFCDKLISLVLQGSELYTACSSCSGPRMPPCTNCFNFVLFRVVQRLHLKKKV